MRPLFCKVCGDNAYRAQLCARCIKSFAKNGLAIETDKFGAYKVIAIGSAKPVKKGIR